MSDDQLNYDPDVPASSPTENSGPVQEPTLEPEEFTITDEELKTYLSAIEEQQKSRTECNPDSEGLGAIPAGPCLIGCVDEVNGKSAEEIPAFVPTRHELIQLVKYWIKEVLDLDFWWFLSQTTGSTEIRVRPFAIRRINRIADAVGDDQVRKAVRDVTDEYAQKASRDEWIVFQYGTAEEEAFYHDDDNLDNRNGFVKAGVAGELASKVVDRIFREGTPEQQEDLLKAELRRYSCILRRYWPGGHFIQLFGIDFPCEVKPLVLKTGVDDPAPDPDRNTFFKLSVQQGKSILAALDEVARKGEDALKALVQGKRLKPSKAS